MKQSLAFFLFFGTILVFTRCNTKESSENTRKGISASMANALDVFTQNAIDTYPIPGIAMAVVRDGDVYIRAAGQRAASSGAAFTDTTTCFMGNLSELLVATVTLKLAEAGKIHLDDPVVKHLPYFKLGSLSYRDITLRHLLTHTSGVPRHDAMWDSPNTDENALEITTRSVVEQEALFDPGYKVKRSPYNYDILADLIRNVTGKPFEQYASESVFAPMGMTASTFMKADFAENNLAMPHQVGNWLSYTLAQAESYPYNREHAGSIGLHASIRDMALWMKHLLDENEKLLSHDSKEALLTKHVQTGDNYFVGLGWEIEKFGDAFIFKKTHETGGFSADITMIPARKTAVIVVSNIGGDFAPQALSHKVIAWLNGQGTLHIKIPVHLAMSKKLAETGNLDSALTLYTALKHTNAEVYDLGMESLSQLGFNLLYRVQDPGKAEKVFEFCAGQFQESAYAHLNLAEAHLVGNNLAKASEALAMVKKLPVDHPEMTSRLAYVEEMLTAKKETNDTPAN